MRYIPTPLPCPGCGVRVEYAGYDEEKDSTCRTHVFLCMTRAICPITMITVAELPPIGGWPEEDDVSSTQR